MKALYLLGLLLLYCSATELPRESSILLSPGQITAIILGFGLVFMGSLPEIKKTLKEVMYAYFG